MAIASSRLRPCFTAPSASASAIRARYAGPLPASAVAISISFSFASQRVVPIAFKSSIASSLNAASPVSVVIDFETLAARFGMALTTAFVLRYVLIFSMLVPAKTE